MNIVRILERLPQDIQEADPLTTPCDDEQLRVAREMADEEGWT